MRERISSGPDGVPSTPRSMAMSSTRSLTPTTVGIARIPKRSTWRILVCVFSARNSLPALRSAYRRSSSATM